MRQDFILEQKLDEFTHLLIECVNRYPAKEKPSLGAETKRVIYSLTETCIWIKKSHNKGEHILKFDVQIEYLRSLMRQANKFKILRDGIHRVLSEKLGLSLSKWSLYGEKQGVDFAGYRIWTTHIKPRKRNVYRARRRLKAQLKRGDVAAYKASLASYNGYLKHCTGNSRYVEKHKYASNGNEYILCEKLEA